jgi:uncharacterized protein (TIGR03083 family)
LRDRVLAASRAARPGGRPVPEPPVVTAAEAFRRAADALLRVLTALDPDEWRLAVLRDLDVRGLVGHLIGVEHDVQSALRGDPEVADADHVASTQPAATRQGGRAPHQTLAEWCRAVARTLDEVDAAGASGHVLSLHGMRLSLDALLVVRAFELWIHENDIRTVVGLPPSEPDAATLALMTNLAVQLLPHSARRTDVMTGPVDLRLVLTGAGGGTWDLELGSGFPTDADPTDVLLVLAAVDFCRMVANRVAAAELPVHVVGPTAHAAGVFTAAAALALD